MGVVCSNYIVRAPDPLRESSTFPSVILGTTSSDSSILSEILGDSWRFLEILGNSWRFLKILPYVATHLKDFQKYSGIFTGLKHDTKIQLGNLQLENDQ